MTGKFSQGKEGGRSYEEGGLGASIEDTFSDPGLAMGKEGVDGVLEGAAAGNKGVDPACLDGCIVQHSLRGIRGRRGCGCGGLSGPLDGEERGRRHVSLSLPLPLVATELLRQLWRPGCQAENLRIAAGVCRRRCVWLRARRLPSDA